MNTTPVSILERLRQPENDRAWEQFVQIYTPLLYAWARQLGMQSHDAAELVQDVFMVLIEKLPQFQYDSSKSFRGWLRTLLTNKWKNRLRGKGRFPSREQSGSPEIPIQPSTPEFEAAEYRQFVINRAMELLQAEFPEASWNIGWQIIVAGRPPAEIAEQQGVTVNSVYLVKSRMLRRLRMMLSGLLT